MFVRLREYPLDESPLDREDAVMRFTIDVLAERAKITVEQLAERSGVPSSRVEAIVTGRWLPKPADRERLAEALGVQVDDVEWGHSISPRNVRYHRFGLSEDIRDEQTDDSKSSDH